jgi:hypothetical protein
MFGRIVMMLSIIAGAVATSLSASSQTENPAYSNEARVQAAGSLVKNTPGNGLDQSPVNNNDALATDRPRGFHRPSRRDFKGLWVPIFAGSLAGFLYVRLSHRSAYAIARPRHSEETRPRTNYSQAGSSLMGV